MKKNNPHPSSLHADQAFAATGRGVAGQRRIGGGARSTSHLGAAIQPPTRRPADRAAGNRARHFRPAPASFERCRAITAGPKLYAKRRGRSALFSISGLNLSGNYSIDCKRPGALAGQPACLWSAPKGWHQTNPVAMSCLSRRCSARH